MSEFTRCPHCGFTHTRRPDGLCPRCSGALGDSPPVVVAAAPAVKMRHGPYEGHVVLQRAARSSDSTGMMHRRHEAVSVREAVAHHGVSARWLNSLA
jgi:hypothetical protein